MSLICLHKNRKSDRSLEQKCVYFFKGSLRYLSNNRGADNLLFLCCCHCKNYKSECLVSADVACLTFDNLQMILLFLPESIRHDY